MTEVDSEMRREVDYEVRRSTRARNVRVHVDPTTGHVHVVVPQRASKHAAADAVAQLNGWIGKRVAEAHAAQATVKARGATVPYLDSTLTLQPEPGRTRVHRKGDRLLVPTNDKPALERWYRRQARAEIVPRLDDAVKTLGVTYSSLRIGAPKTRWGSCSAKGAMSFNWRLLLAPDRVLDYVVWHEACHLRVLDHSHAFWDLVATHVPGYKEPSNWLRANGPTLVL